MPEDLIDREPTAEKSEAGKANFVVSSTINEIDCCELSVKGHCRSLFAWAAGEPETKWLTP